MIPINFGLLIAIRVEYITKGICVKSRLQTALRGSAHQLAVCMCIIIKRGLHVYSDY